MPSAPTSKPRPHILTVDDAVAVRQLARRTLAPFDCEVSDATSQGTGNPATVDQAEVLGHGNADDQREQGQRDDQLDQGEAARAFHCITIRAGQFR